MFDDVLFVGASVSLYYCGNMLATNVQHALYLVRREQFVQSTQLEVALLVGNALFTSHQLQMCIHEAVKVQP